jgi:hypothetical protein
MSLMRLEVSSVLVWREPLPNEDEDEVGVPLAEVAVAAGLACGYKVPAAASEFHSSAAEWAQNP